MKIYLRCDNDRWHQTYPEDPQRQVWYSRCGFWTDDWNKLGLVNDIYQCPKCGEIGRYVAKDSWLLQMRVWAKTQKFDDYEIFIEKIKEKCFGLDCDWRDLYRRFMA